MTQLDNETFAVTVSRGDSVIFHWIFRPRTIKKVHRVGGVITVLE